MAETKILVQKGLKDVANMNCIRLGFVFAIAIGICGICDSAKNDSPQSSVELTCYVRTKDLYQVQETFDMSFLCEIIFKPKMLLVIQGISH